MYDLSDIDSVLNTTEPSPTEPVQKFTYPDTNTDSNSVVVVPRRGILKKSSHTDPKKRLSACSTGSNSSADILDFSYDSGDENYDSLSKCPQMSREGSLVGISNFEDMNSEGELLNTMTQKDYDNDENEFLDSEKAREIYEKAMEIVKEVQLDSQ